MSYLRLISTSVFLGLLSACVGPAPEEVIIPTPPPLEGPTWPQDVAPLVTRSCMGCHATGRLAFSLESYEAAAPYAAAMAKAVAENRMPPWGAQETDRCTPPFGWKEDPRLTDEEKAVIEGWAAAGAPPGDPASAAPLPVPLTRSLEEYDQLLYPRLGYTPSGTEDEYICFSLDPQLAATRWLTGLEVVPGNRAVVHHLGVVVDPNADSATLAGTQGYYDCAGGEGLSEPQAVTLWSPGMPPMEVPSGSGIRVAAGSRILLAVHYHPEPGGPTGMDVTALKLRWTDEEPPMTASVLLAGNVDTAQRGLLSGPNDASGAPEFRIPANVAGHTEAMEWRHTGGPTYTIWSMGSHMHYIGTKMVTKLYKAGQTEPDCLLETPRWDFDWQLMYDYEAPFDALPTLGPGDHLYMECTFDNTAESPGVQRLMHETGETEPRDVLMGPGTRDEMCLAYVGIVY